MTGYLDLDSDVSVEHVPSTGTSNYSLISGKARQPSSPASGTYITGADILGIPVDEYTVDNTIDNIDTATQVKVWLNALDTASHYLTSIDIYINGSWVGYQTQDTPVDWTFFTFSGTYTQADIDNLKIRLKSDPDGSGDSADCVYYALYVELTYTETVGGGPEVPDSPTVHYKFDEADGSTVAVDSVGDKNGTYYGSIAFEQQGLVSGSSIQLNRTNTYIDIPKTTVTGLTDFTISFWTVWDGPRSSNQQHLFDFNNGISPTNLSGKYFCFAPDYYKTSKPALTYTIAGASNDQYVNCSADLPLGSRVYVVITHTGNTTIVYFNGVEVGRNDISIDLSDIQLTWIGRSPWSSDDYYNGRLDDFKIYNYGLSSQDVLDQYNDANGSIDYITIGQGLSVQMVYARTISDSATIVDLVGPQAILEDHLDLTSTDSVGVTGIYNRDASDFINILESTQVALVHDAQVEDILFIDDSAIGGNSHSIVDTLTIIDTADLYQQKLGNATDALIFSDTVIIEIPGKFNIVVSDTLSITEAMGNPGAKTASANDNIVSLFDQFTYIGPHPASLADTYLFTESVTKIGPNYLSIVDKVIVTETIHSSPSVGNLNDTLTFTESFHVSPSIGTASDTLTITDTHEVWTNTKTATDTLTFTDSVDYHLAVVNVSLSDTLTFIESMILMTPIISIDLTDTLTFIEHAYRVQDFSIEDTLTFTEQAYRTQAATFTDTLTITDSHTEVGSKYQSDSLEFYEEICVFLNYNPTITDNLTFNDRATVPNNPNPGTIGTGTFELKGVYSKRVYDRLFLVDSLPDIPASFTNCDRFFNDTLVVTDLVTTSRGNWFEDTLTFTDTAVATIPLSPVTGMAAWYKADAGLVDGSNNPVTSNGATISVWQDQSGNARHTVIPAIWSGPTLLTSGVNGLPLVRFTPTQMFEVQTVFTTPCSIFLVARMYGATKRRILAGRTANWLLGWWNGGYNQMYASGSVLLTGSPSEPGNVIRIYSSVQTGSLSSFWNSGTLVASNTGGLVAPGFLGINGDGSESSHSDIAEILVYSSALSTGDRQTVENYLISRWT
jgi:hypothetical protein